MTGHEMASGSRLAAGPQRAPDHVESHQNLQIGGSSGLTVNKLGT